MNQLQYESSPYLLQHAHNPVNWYAWRPETLQKAQAEDKPILVSIGYSTCHWCHVMERESFENEAVAAFMNQHFINIKIDREERPDLDQIYMDACQAISGSGGWPLNCFLTPDGRPFFAGTYYPPVPAHNRPSWIQLLQHIQKTYTTRREEVEAQANQLTQLIQNNNQVFFSDQLGGRFKDQVFTPAVADAIFEQMKTHFDMEYGGFGGAPKFPSTMSLRYLLQYHYQIGDPTALAQVHLSLHKMIRGGIYDQIGGGFARYATDRAWLVPHFEKMLYDNALILELIADLYRITGMDLYKDCLIQSLEFIEREMSHPEGGFFAALDADSEGVEGKFYVWSYKEVQLLLGDEASLFCAFYGIKPEGNWEGSNILRQTGDLELFAKQHEYSPAALAQQFHRNRAALLEARGQRIRPGLDNKILLGWNALMCTTYVKAYQATGKAAYRERAKKGLEFLLAKMAKPGGGYYHSCTYVDGEPRLQYDAFLHDYAFLISAMLVYHRIGQDKTWLRKTADLIDRVITDFLDQKENLFYFTSAKQSDIPIRKKELFDNAIPSGNSMMMQALLQAAIVIGKPEYRDLALRMGIQVEKGVQKYPTSFAHWAAAFLKLIYPPYELAVVGAEAEETARQINRLPVLNYEMVASKTEDKEWPLLAGKPAEAQTKIYICRDFTCDRPVETIEEVRPKIAYQW